MNIQEVKRIFLAGWYIANNNAPWPSASHAYFSNLAWEEFQAEERKRECSSRASIPCARRRRGTPMTQVWCDLDGVLADLDGAYERQFGWRPMMLPERKVDWKYISEHLPHFFAGVEPLPDARWMWDHLEGLCQIARLPPPRILTGIRSDMPKAAEDKRAWVLAHLGIAGDRVYVCNPVHKAQFCKPGDIIIDDHTSPARHAAWREAGGTWVVHESPIKSVGALVRLLANL